MTPISFESIWPGGNTTAIVTHPVDPHAYVHIGRAIMCQHPSVEQVGFITKPLNSRAHTRLDMMGGEFCGNAARSAAFVWANQYNLSSLNLEVSGYSRIVEASIVDHQVTIRLAHDFIVDIQKAADDVLVRLHGIQHLVTDKNIDATEARSLVQHYAVHHSDIAAMGVISLRQYDQDSFRIDPYVWVRTGDTFIRETGCASGSIAVAAALHRQNPHKHSFRLIQPSDASYNVDMSKIGITLSGIVKPLADVGRESILIDPNFLRPAAAPLPAE